MKKDIGWKTFLLDDERFADIINGIGCGGKQIITKDDLQDADTQVWITARNQKKQGKTRKKKPIFKIRDSVRKVAFGVNFAIVGIENHEKVDYSLPLKSLIYDVGIYEKQASKIRKSVSKNHAGLDESEYLYRFRKDSKLNPVITIVLYSGKEEWEGHQSLYDILDFTNIPPGLQKMVADYKVNLINIRQLKDTSMFKTDVKQVFDFIRCANDKKALKELTENDDYYKNMQEDAFDVAVSYTNATELIAAKEEYCKEGDVNMCQALKDLIADGREEGREEGRIALIKKFAKNLSVEQIAEALEEDVDTIRKLVKKQ